MVERELIINGVIVQNLVLMIMILMLVETNSTFHTTALITDSFSITIATFFPKNLFRVLS